MLERPPSPSSSARWPECCPWVILFRSFHISIGGPLLLATIGSIAVAAGWNLTARVLLTEESLDHRPTETFAPLLQRWPADRRFEQVNLWSALPDALGTPPQDPVTTVPVVLTGPLVAILNPNLSWRAGTFFAIGWIWSILVWSILGCAITRMAVLKYTWNQNLDFGSALQYARTKWIAHLTAVGTPLLGILAVGIPIVVLAVLMRTSIGAALGGILWGGVLAISLFSGVLALGLLLGWPLIWGALATEDSDAFDALSRTYAYTFQGIGRYACYLLVAAAVGIAGWLVVWLFSEMVIALSEWTAALGMGAERLHQLVTAPNVDALSSLDRFAAYCIFGWVALLRSIASGYAYAFFWTAFAGVYLLLRHDVEATPLDDVDPVN